MDLIELNGCHNSPHSSLGQTMAVAEHVQRDQPAGVPPLELTGERNWFMPRWLDRALPDLSFEGGSDPEPAEA